MDTSIEPVRVMLVGAGRVSAAHITAIDTSGALRLVGVVDPDVSAGHVMADSRGAWVATGLDEALARGDAEAAVVATPTNLHYAQGHKLIEAGIHTLIEKPMAPTAETVRTLRAAARAADRVLASAQVVRFLPTSAAARAIISANSLGPIEQIVQRRMEFRAEAVPWWSQLPHFLLNHWGSHSIDMAIDLFHVQVDSVYCRARTRLHGFDSEDNVNLLGELVGGGRLALNLSMSSRQPRHDMLVVGSQGTIELIGYTSVLYNGATVFERPEEEVLRAGFVAQLEDFAMAIRTGSDPIASATSILPCYAVLDAAARSIDTGAVVSIPPKVKGV